MEKKTWIDPVMKDVFIASDNIVSSLGFTTDENMQRMKSGETGIRQWKDESLSPESFWASRVDGASLQRRFSVYADPAEYTRFEQMVICSVMDALRNTAVVLRNKRTLFILSTTKGNIELLRDKTGKTSDDDRIYLWKTADLLQRFFNLFNKPWVISNACISGLVAIMAGARLIRAGQFDHAVVVGADLVSEFVLSGFNSFLSLSNGPCRPFDKDRQGLSLGEGAGTIVLTSDPSQIMSPGVIKVGYGCTSNDANHISGPSRTGEGLYRAIRKTLENSKPGVDYISAHGTATPYNDEMESIAITRAGLQHIPVNSFKGYWGHTLGAAGVIESIAGAYSLRNNLLFNTLGFAESGTSNPVAVIHETRENDLNTCLKIASGFGGCNAALLLHK
jgi:3-oxoacyl-[acyl-carrier-protein] synthase I